MFPIRTKTIKAIPDDWESFGRFSRGTEAESSEEIPGRNDHSCGKPVKV